MDRVTSKEIIKNLIDIGYTLSEIYNYFSLNTFKHIKKWN